MIGASTNTRDRENALHPQDTWETLYFWMVVIQSRGVTALINTGPPRDLTELNQFWHDFAGDRCLMIRREEERPETALKAVGVDSQKVDYVFLTPLQGYATANVPLFRNATICISRRGWIEDFHAPPLEIHVPRRLRIPIYDPNVLHRHPKGRLA